MRRGERGQALIEFALIFPFILALGLVIIDFGSALDHREVIQHSLREGTRAAAYGASEASIISTVVGNSEGLVDASDVSVCYVDGPDAGTTVGDEGDSVRVRVAHVYNFTVGSGGLLTAFGVPAPSIGMNPSAEGRLETDVAGVIPCP